MIMITAGAFVLLTVEAKKFSER